MNNLDNNDPINNKDIENELDKLDNPKSKKNKKKLISSIIFCLMVMIVFFSLLFSMSDINKMLETFSNIANGTNYVWLIYAVLAVFVLYPIPLLILSKSFDKNTSTSDAILIGAGEHFFNGVTPFAAGGQPIQIYDFTKKGMKAATATGLVLSNFIIYLVVLNLYEVLALIFYPSFSDAIMSYSMSNFPISTDTAYL